MFRWLPALILSLPALCGAAPPFERPSLGLNPDTLRDNNMALEGGLPDATLDQRGDTDTTTLAAPALICSMDSPARLVSTTPSCTRSTPLSMVPTAFWVPLWMASTMLVISPVALAVRSASLKELVGFWEGRLFLTESQFGAVVG